MYARNNDNDEAKKTLDLSPMNLSPRNNAPPPRSTYLCIFNSGVSSPSK